MWPLSPIVFVAVGFLWSLLPLSAIAVVVPTPPTPKPTVMPAPDGPTVFVEVNEEDTSLATLYKSAVHGQGRVNSRDVAGTLHGCDFRGALAATNVDLVCDGTRARALGDG
jgi:hypothetical protein